MRAAIDALMELNQAGRLLDRRGLELLPEPQQAPWNVGDHLRDALTASSASRVGRGEGRATPQSKDAEPLGPLLDVILEEVCGLKEGWRKGPLVGAAEAEALLDGTVLKPRRLLVLNGETSLAVFGTSAERVGLHQGRRVVAQVVEYLRRRRLPFGLLTNGREWRFIFADADNLAWVEWAADRWLEGDTLTDSLSLLRRVLSPASLAPAAGAADQARASRLLEAVRQTRRGQARLSMELGERVRACVELLLHARRPVLEPSWNEAEGASVYDAACHFAMRLVIVLFAEARELLPVDSPIYHHAYGLRGLLEALGRAGADRRKARASAWARLLALFRLLHQGSFHPQLVVTAYGGDLFRAGDPAGDAIQRALARLETTAEPPDDETIYRMLVLLTRTTERVREGDAFRTVAAPVDFTELTSEYIGILYQGLLDYELHRVGSQPIVFLGLGDEPALPLDRLEAMSDKQLSALVEKAKIKRAAASDEGGGDEESEDAEDDALTDEDAEAGEPEPESDVTVVLDELAEGDVRGEAMRRALAWAERAAVAGNLVKAPRGKKGRADPSWKAELARAAQSVIAREEVEPGKWRPMVRLPGELYVVRWGGTRKGAGTFYTRPQLTLPTVRRTLDPLLTGSDGRIRSPEDLLALKVCDPAMGSGSFLVASLRILTDAVVRSLHEHKRIVARSDAGTSELVRIDCDLLPEADRDQPTERVDAIVRRAVVEHCLYGVDIDPLAVELARVSLWVETLDRRLPFTFLDHKLRCGDALVGTWLDRFRDYPLLAWWRQSPDEKWRGVTHEGDLWAETLKERRKAVVAEQVELLTGQRNWLANNVSDDELKAAIDRMRELYRRLRNVPASQPDKRAELWRTQVAPDPALARVREAFDTWCALWFWPVDKLDEAPGPAALPAPPERAREIVRTLRNAKHFFHWELEFPDVFTEKGAGFDAIVANPPWETLQAQSMEFFSDIDPLYRSYGKQEGLRIQREMFERDSRVERAWLDNVAEVKNVVNWVRHAGAPFGDSEDSQGKPEAALASRKPADSKRLHSKWSIQRAKRSGLSDPQHPFRFQGDGKPYSYKMFAEQSLALLKIGGQLGLITPSSLYTDSGTADLRRLFLESCSWRWLYGFENRLKVFDIDSRFKFAVTIAQKGGTTESVRAAFMRHDLDDWGEAKAVLDYPSERIHAFSPKNLSILELRTQRDLDVLTRMRRNAVALGDDSPAGWRVRYKREFNATDDSSDMPPLPEWLAKDFRASRYLHFEDSAGNVGLPVLSGRIIDQFNFAAASWLSGKGRGSIWEATAARREGFRPEFLMDSKTYRSSSKRFGYPKMVFMEVVSATNERTCFGSLVPDWPGIHKTPCMWASDGNVELTAALTAIFNSFAFDYSARMTVGGLSLGWFVLEALPLPKRSTALSTVARLAIRLNCTHEVMAPFWIGPSRQGLDRHVWRELWAETRAERLRIRSAIDAICIALYELSRDDLAWILRDCDHPKERIADKSFCRSLDPKGFWRIDKREDPELRHTVLTLVAFDALEKLIAQNGGDRCAGVAAFSALNNGAGWMLPETLRLADYGLGHDERAKQPQPVASRLGPRFLDWQLVQTPEESWTECERHARVILGEEEFDRRMAKPTAVELDGRADAPPKISVTPKVTPATSQLPLFGPKAPAHPSPIESLPMTISRIRLLNFRNWTDKQWRTGIELRPITLMLGRNSAGKTSILQPLRMLKQSIESTDAGTHLNLTAGASEGANLGAFVDVVNGHDPKRELGVGVDLAEKGVSVDVRFRQVDERPVIESLAYRIRDENVEVSRTQNAYQLASPRFRLPNWDGARGVHEPKKAYEPGRAIEFSEQALADLGVTLGPQVRGAMLAVKEALSAFSYLGPLRPPPAREVTWSQQDPTRLGSTGSETVQALIGNETGRNKGALKQAVSEWLKKLDLADGIEVSRIGKSLLYQIEVLRGGERSNLVDVGYGVSQVLPLIVLLHFVPEGSVILCEDPEAHLHPMAQAGLANMFVDLAKKRRLQILLETHSEHLFRRLQSLIAARAARHEDCALYYVERDEPSAKLTSLESDEFGRVKNWPEHLFGDAVGETGRQMRSMVTRLGQRGADK